MIKTNKLMDINIGKELDHDMIVNNNISKIIDDIINNTYLVNDCVIYSSSVDENKVDWGKIFKLYKDKNDYEVNCNELIYDKKLLGSRLYGILGEGIKDALIKKYKCSFSIYIIE